MILGIAGKSGAGKNLAADFLEDRGWKTLDLDQVAHRALDVLANRLGEELGPEILRPGGGVDRKALGRLVFSRPSQLALLENITYPWIEKEVREWLGDNPGFSLAVHGINLHKTGLLEDFDALLWIFAPGIFRRRRVQRREHRNWGELKGRFKHQRSLGPQLYSGRVKTLTLWNHGSPQQLKKRLDRILFSL